MGTVPRPPRVTLARDAAEFIDRVEASARELGADTACLHHWVAEACRHPFLARTVARRADVDAARDLMRRCLAADAPGPAWPPAAVLDRARTRALERGDDRIRAWHLVVVVLERFGIASRGGSDDRADAGDQTGGAGDRAGDAGETAPDARGGAGATSPAPDPDRATAPPSSSSPPSPRTSARPRRQPEAAATRRPATPLLDQCGVDWTALAAEGRLPPCVGREAELALLVEGLCRPTKPNVMLVGEPGVGKSAIVEGLAQRMADGRVPEPLLGRRLIALNMSELTRESRYYGVMEQRLGELIGEARAVRAILFIDEGHAMTGSGGREGTGDVASVFKPALARGDLSLISATTEEEYRRFIAPNGALERRFNVVRVVEPDRAAVRTMLAAHRDRIAAAHGIDVPDAALDRLVAATAVRLSHRRESDRSRDLLDQAVARAIAAGVDAVSSRDVDATARAASGAPEVGDDSLAALREALVVERLLSPEDAGRLVERLANAYAGLALRPERPKAAVLLVRPPGGASGFALAEAVARHVFGAPERVIMVDVGGIREPSAISGFLGTTQGFIGHGAPVPVQALLDRPHSVLLLRGVDAAHEALRSLLAAAIRDGYLTDGQARRIPLSQAVLVLEARGPKGSAPRSIGFALAPGPGAEPSARSGAALAEAAVGEDLAGECDVVARPPADGGRVGASGWVAAALARLADAYLAAGVELAWDADVVALLGARAAPVPARERERVVESSVGRAVRPLLRDGLRPVPVRVRSLGGELMAEVDDADGASA